MNEASAALARATKSATASDERKEAAVSVRARSGEAHGSDRVEVFAGNSEDCPARHEHRDGRGFQKQSSQDRGDVQQVFKVVEDEQERSLIGDSR